MVAQYIATDMVNIKAATLPPSTLQKRPLSAVCADFLAGFCRRGDLCRKSHEICAIVGPNERPEAAPLESSPNYLSPKPRLPLPNGCIFDDDGPGSLSSAGARHQNDHVHIRDITILPMTDEILCTRLPYVPKKDQNNKHHLPCGLARHIDTNFRQLRYEHTESIIDICYHASQRLIGLSSQSPTINYNPQVETPQGRRYSLFRDVEVFELSFEERRGLSVRASFSCPPELRGPKLRAKDHFEKGMLAALIGFNKDSNTLSTTFLEVSLCQSTEAMKIHTHNELRASVILNFADRQDTAAVRRLLYNRKGLLSEKFILIEFPKTLLAGFSFCLKQLQDLSRGDAEIAFSSLIAPSTATMSPSNPPPKYTTPDDFSFKCNILQGSHPEGYSALALKPNLVASDEKHQQDFIELLRNNTTLDDGQASALCENLCRGLAFTQGPPGTGKTYLGVALARVILESRPLSNQKPILAVCMTNHALDSFLEDLRDAGVTKLARLGRGSKEDWIKPIQISELTHNMKITQIERSQLTSAYMQTEGLHKEGVGWCEALNLEFVSWPAVRGHLKVKYRSAYDSFVELETVSQAGLSDIRLARKAGGFAFEFWCQGGDIKDVDQLLDCFSTLLGSNDSSSDTDATEISKDRVITIIKKNVKQAVGSRKQNDVWHLSLKDRKLLLKKWTEEVNSWTIIDQTVEIHRRYQQAIIKKTDVQQQVDARCLLQQQVIGLTTTACAMNWPLLNKLGIQIVICEEAGEVMEAQTLCTLFGSVEHAIFIGDPQQLRPQVTERSLSLETTSGKGYRLDESLFERMMFPSAPGMLPLATSRLNLQRRMHPDIADIMRATLYPYLQDHESTHRHPPVAGMTERIWWLDHQRPEDSPDPQSTMAKSFTNTFEFDMTIGLVKYLVNGNEYDYNDIAILTPYNGQLAALNDKLSQTCAVWLSDKDRQNLIDRGLLNPETNKPGEKADVRVSSMLRVATIDNFQGEEAKVIILSTVRSNLEGRIGFLKTCNRINVACSRARDGFYIIGNSSLMKGAKMWDQIINLFDEKDKIQRIFKTRCPRHAEHQSIVGEATCWDKIPPCEIPCGLQLPCGHWCKEKCHAPSLHTRMSCQEPCIRHHKICGHQFTNICGEPCGTCSQKLPPIELPCGHLHTLTCTEKQEEKEIVCDIVVESVPLACGHTQKRACSDKEHPAICPKDCKTILECGHLCSGKCSDCQVNPKHATCGKICGKTQICGHECSVQCHSGSCPPCKVPSNIIDGQYAKMGQQMLLSMDSIINTTDVLRRSYEDFCKSLKSSPLTGQTNERLVRFRGNAMMKTQQEVIHFRDDIDNIVCEIEKDSARLAQSHGHSMIPVTSNLPFKMRFDSLYYRCRLATMEESVQMCKLLDTLEQSSHTTAMLLSLQEMTVTQSIQNIAKIQSSIAECETRNLKRLEVEMRLIQIAFHLILKSIGKTSRLNFKESLKKVQTTCTIYPETAGIFYSQYESLKSSCEGISAGKGPCAMDGRKFWQQWGAFEAGDTRYCVFGHPYSAKSFSACPECGRKVDKVPKKDRHIRLQEDAFLEYLLKMNKAVKV